MEKVRGGERKAFWVGIVSGFLDLTSSLLHWVKVLEAAGSRSG